MNQDLYDKVREGISQEVGGSDPELDYAAVEAMKAFAKFLHSRRWYSTDEILFELRDMLLLECGDFRSDLDEFLGAR